MVYFKLINSFNFDFREKRKAATAQFLSCFECGILKFTLSYTVYLDLKNIIATNILIIFIFTLMVKMVTFPAPFPSTRGLNLILF